MSKVEARLRGLMLTSTIMGVIDIAVGVLLALYFDFTIKSFSIIIGSVILLHGLFYMIRYLYDGLGKKVFAVDLIMAVANIILGLFTVFFKFETVNTLGIIYCVYLVSNSVEKLYYAMKFKAINDSVYPLMCVFGIVLLVMGIIVPINPFKNFVLVTKLIGIFMVGSGVFDCMMCRLFMTKADVLLKMFK